MKRGFLLIGIILISFVMNRVNAQYMCPIPSGDLVLRITSDHPKSSVGFEAAYIFGDTSAHLNTVRGTTPYEIPVSMKFSYGIFCKTSGDSKLKITLINIDKGKEHQILSGWADVDILEVKTVKNQLECTVKTRDIKSK